MTELELKLQLQELNGNIFEIEANRAKELEPLKARRFAIEKKLDAIDQKKKQSSKKLKLYEEIALEYLKTTHSVFLERKDILENTEVSKKYPKELIQVLQDIVHKNEKEGKIKVHSVDINDTIFEPWGCSRVNFERI